MIQIKRILGVPIASLEHLWFIPSIKMDLYWIWIYSLVSNKWISSGDIQGAWAQSQFTQNEFIELKFATDVYVKNINIYETYHCGGVVRIKLKDKSINEWRTVWKAENGPENLEGSRIFSPDLEKTLFKTNQVRLELDCRLANTYCEIDAVG